jgi:MFS family permease
MKGSGTLLRQEDGLSKSSYGSAPCIGAATTPPPPPPLHPILICGVLSTAFCYGCVVTTLFLLVLPIECARIELLTRETISKSIALGAFAAIAGTSQLICPLVGMLSDRYRPRTGTKRRRRRNGGDHSEAGDYCEAHQHRWVRGRRLPYLLFGSALVEIGLVGMNILSMASNYPIYTIFFALAMVGINITYCVMIALIPDLIPHEQTGLANGSLGAWFCGCGICIRWRGALKAEEIINVPQKDVKSSSVLTYTGIERRP